MVCKCPHCDGALEYNPSYKKMQCPFCGGIFESQSVIVDIDKTLQSEQKEWPENKENVEGLNSIAAETMKCNIYTCTSCGGELMVNGVESSTFCAYCGQPTIVFSRVSQELKPKYILPFQINKEQALNIFRKRASQSKFSPDAAMNIQPDKVRGIYIPYFIQDIYYYRKMKFYEGKKLYIREADCLFQDLYLEASSKVDDITSQYLEPFYLKDLKPFEPGYLSGFYADRYDVNYQTNTERYLYVINKMFRKELRNSVNEEHIDHTEDDSRHEVRRNDYALLPIWFVTFRHKDAPYTMMINGQTGKIVGSMPIDKKKIIKKVILITLIATLAVLPIYGITMIIPPVNFIIAMIANILLYLFGILSIVAAYLNTRNTQNKKVTEFVENRQEDGK